MEEINKYSLEDLLNDERIVRAIQNEKHLSDEEVEQLLHQIKNRYQMKRRNTFRLRIYSVAAVIVLLILSGVGLYLRHSTAALPTYDLSAMAKLVPGSSDIQLVLGSKRFTFSQDVDVQVKDGKAIVREKKSGKTFTYPTDLHLELNKLYTPKGKCSTVTLSDGTKVWINSGTTFVFPSAFATSSRSVNLNGEAFLAVAKNAAKPFYVRTSAFDVRVTGTQFNVNAYKGDENMSVVLAEGGVQVTSRDKKYLINMSPNEMATFNKGQWSLNEVDADDYICWKDGYLQLSGVTLNDVFLRLSRHYNVNITWNKSAATQKCSGKLALFDNVNEIMTSLSSIFNMNYTISKDNIKVNLKP